LDNVLRKAVVARHAPHIVVGHVVASGVDARKPESTPARQFIDTISNQRVFKIHNLSQAENILN